MPSGRRLVEWCLRTSGPRVADQWRRREGSVSELSVVLRHFPVWAALTVAPRCEAREARHGDRHPDSLVGRPIALIAYLIRFAQTIVLGMRSMNSHLERITAAVEELVQAERRRAQ